MINFADMDHQQWQESYEAGKANIILQSMEPNELRQSAMRHIENARYHNMNPKGMGHELGMAEACKYLAWRKEYKR